MGGNPRSGRFSGLGDNDRGAARISVNEETEEPTPYIHPNNPKILLWDLPGFGGLKHTYIKKYSNFVNLKNYEALLIFVWGRMTHHDVELVKEVESMGKPFFFIRAHVNTECENALKFRGLFGSNNEEEINAVVEETLNEMKRVCFENVGDLLASDLLASDIFLIDNYVREQYDFDRLRIAIENSLPERLAEAFALSLSNVTHGTLKRKANLLKVVKGSPNSKTENQNRVLGEAKQFVKDHGVDGIHELHREKMNDWRNVTLHFGVTGSSGAGKSVFINAIRGLRGNELERGAARLNIGETTEPTPYIHPNNPKMVLWDLPGFGALEHTDIKKYSNFVDLKNYEALLIFVRGWITHHDVELAKKVESMKKPFFFIRAHANTECENALKGRGLFGSNNEEEINAVVEETLNEIRRVCFINVGDLLTSRSDVFVIDNYVREEYDFDRLQIAIENSLPERLTEAFALSLSNVTRGTLKRKANLLKVRATIVAGATAATSFIPVPVVGEVIDLALILHEITNYPKILGLSDENSNISQWLSEEIKEKLKKYMFKTIRQLFDSLMEEGLAKEFGSQVAKYIPGPGTILSCAKSFAFTTKYLHDRIDYLEDVALQIWKYSEPAYN